MFILLGTLLVIPEGIRATGARGGKPHTEMERKMHSKLLAAACFLGVAAAAGPASAIECRGNFQIQKNGNRIATPYCQDGYLAIVAREYGLRVSADTIRYNPTEKDSVCRLIGQDNRVSEACQGSRLFDKPGGR